MSQSTSTKTKFKGLNSKPKLQKSKQDISRGCISWKTQIQRGWIVFGLLTVFSFNAFGQCGVRDLPDSTQKNILGKFLLLERCDSLQIESAEEIMSLKGNILSLQADNIEAVSYIESLQLEALKRKKWVWISGAVGLIVGILTGNKLK